MNPHSSTPQPSRAQPNTFRLFVAIPLWNEFREKALPLYEELHKFRWALRWVDPCCWHLTLKFLGDVPADAVPVLCKSLSNDTEQFQPFPVELGTLGAFPRLSKTRVLWVGITNGMEPLKQLADRIDHACTAAGYPGDRKPFTGHLTLARARNEPVAIKVPPVLLNHSWGSIEVDSCALVKSTLTSTGPHYEVLKSFQFPSLFEANPLQK